MDIIIAAAIPIAALIVTLGGLIWAMGNGKATALQALQEQHIQNLTADVKTLESRVKVLEVRLEDCERQRNQLMAENLELRRERDR